MYVCTLHAKEEDGQYSGKVPIHYVFVKQQYLRTSYIPRVWIYKDTLLLSVLFTGEVDDPDVTSSLRTSVASFG